MAQQPDDAERYRKIDNGRDGAALEPFEEPQGDGVRFGGSAMTTEPRWVLVSIALGLILLSGSILAIALTVFAGVVVWLARTPPEEGSGPRPNPFGGPITGPGY